MRAVGDPALAPRPRASESMVPPAVALAIMDEKAAPERPRANTIAPVGPARGAGLRSMLIRGFALFGTRIKPPVRLTLFENYFWAAQYMCRLSLQGAVSTAALRPAEPNSTTIHSRFAAFLESFVIENQNVCPAGGLRRHCVSWLPWQGGVVA